MPEKKILIVEDEQLIAHSIERSLFKAGYSVPAMATSADEAFDQIEQTHPDLVLMDIHIQGSRDGVEAARTIRERYHLPVIYLTAHADIDTLERAKITEPLGYLVKPINHANLPSSIEMALYKHKMDRQLEENRALLSTILQSIAEAVVVTDASGKAQFLNSAAEALTGWSQEEATGRLFDEIVPLDTGSDISLLVRALNEHKTMLVPRETTLRTKSGLSIFVDGQIAISKTKGRAAGAMITLHDATIRRQEEQQIRQEQKMLSMGQMANDVANDFYGLFELIASCSEQLTDDGGEEASIEHTAHVIGRASEAGVMMSRQLLDLGEERGLRPALLSLNDILLERKHLYTQLCGPKITLETELGANLDLVLNHSINLEKLTLNLILSAKHSMPDGGRILVSTSNISYPDERGTADKQYIRLVVECERNLPDDSSPLPVSSAQNFELTLTVVNAIVTVSEGSIRTANESDLVSVTEVLLPSAPPIATAGRDVPRVRRTVLTVGFDPESERLLHNRLEDSGFVVLQSASVQEASLVSEFVEGSIDLLIVDGASLPLASHRRIFNLISSRWPDVKVLALSCNDGQPELPNATVLTGPYQLEDLVQAAKGLMGSESAHVPQD